MAMEEEKLYKNKEYPTIGNAFRINDQSIARYPLTLIVHDARHLEIVAKAESAYSGRYPLGYIGTSPWPGSVTNQKTMEYADRQNAMLYDFLRNQMEVGLVVYGREVMPGEEQEILDTIQDMKEKCPDAKQIWICKGEEVLTSLMEEELGKYGISIERYSTEKELEDCFAAWMKEIEQRKPPAHFDTLDREWAEWTNLSITLPVHETENRILLVGDSISAGYGDMVQKRMPGWHVDRLNTSEGLHHPNFIRLLRIALQRYPYCYIHINNGIHLHGQSVEQYGEKLEEVFSWLQKEFGKTAIIFATSTTISRTLEKEELEHLDAKSEHFDAQHFYMGDRAPLAKNTEENQNAEEKYWVTDEKASQIYWELNQKAQEICRRLQIPVNDLYQLCVTENLQKSDGAHFTEEAYGRLADEVAKSLQKAIAKQN